MKKLLHLLLLLASLSYGQSLEPRLYANVPTDLNFLIVGYAYSQGALESNQDLKLSEPHLTFHSAVVGYARGFGVFGKSAKIDIVAPFVDLYGNAKVDGVYTTRKTQGVGDIKVRLALNLIGSPALKLKDFYSYKQDTIVGVSLQLTAPTGKYEKERLVNIGRNIWALKIGAGVSKALGQFLFEVLGDVEFYSKNSQYNTASVKKVDPLYSVQLHCIYNFKRGVWFAVDSNYYWGANSYVDSVSKDTRLSNSRLGVTLALPVNKQNSVKLNYSDGVSTRTGTNFKTGMLAWQYRF